MSSRLLLCLLITFSPVALAFDRVLPEITVQVNDPHRIGVPVRVSLESRKIWRFNYTEYDAETISPGRSATFSGRKEKNMGWLTLRFTWEPRNAAPRHMVYEIRVRRGPKVKGGRGIDPGETKAHYVIDENSNGSCEDLFDYRQEADRSLFISFDLPLTYAPCEADGRAIASIDQIGTRNINQGKTNYFGFDEDKRMGRDFYNQLSTDENPPLEDRRTQAYITDLINRIGKASDMPDLEFKATVIDADVLNAFAVPGGYIWVYRGLIEQTETEAELVGVLAHEIAHVTSRHGTEGMTSAINKIATGMLVSEVLASQTDDQSLKQLIRGLATGGTSFWVVGGTRISEAEADRLGAQYAQRAGYDPNGLATLFQRWGEKKGKQTRIDELFSDHPNDATRVRNVRRDIDYFLPPGDDLIVSSRAYERIKKHLARLPRPKVAGPTAGQALFNSFAQANSALLEKEIEAYFAAAAEEEAEQ